ncbi:MAG: 4a-hydroxytetrahydrobiopterin dehydratase [Microbacteriaceae bacterium]|nr:4a-hydroxytetrahydrobiopterin dehydratase [Microbacteriaceae bacterium]
MVERITPERFLEADGLAGWQADEGSAWATFRTGDFTSGAAFVGAIAEIADELNHHPDVDLRYPSVKVVSSTHSAGGVTELDVLLAQRVTAAAHARGFAID